MEIHLNGEKMLVKEKTTLSDLLGLKQGIAVAVNGEVIFSSQWREFFLKEKDQVEVIAPFQGG